MAIVRLDPFREFATLVAERGNWVPPVDILETEQHDLVLKAELPDMTREDIEVIVEHHSLTIKGIKKPAADVKEDQYRRIERSYGTFSRTFTLPNTVDAGKVGAEYKNGVLTVKLPYREEARPRTINVEVAA
ncbi:MAG: Hsp20/alpha crystallin family protein [Vicinamibacterales bacterium]